MVRKTNAPKKRGRGFKPSERYTNRLNKILVEYPDGPQVLREILQNSDDSKSTEQIFILDHNSYSTDSLLEPDVDNYHNSDLKLDRYQGPALLAKNNTVFEKRDFQSLLSLANSEKRDQFDKIGVMGVGFNSIYHVTDSPSFITGDTYVILDPHEWYFDGGVEFDIVKENLVEDFPDQLAPFKISSLGISFDGSFKRFNGTMFRYPLRTKEDSRDSEIYKKIYEPEEVLDMFRIFYEKESINCLLFLKYVEKITFYELKKGATEPDLLYEIKLENAAQVREQRRLIVESIVPMMESLISGHHSDIKQLESSYVASFCRKRGVQEEESDQWLILNYLDNLLEAESYYQKTFSKSIGEHKFIPNVGLAVPLKNLESTGRLFCFLPLPISMPFLVSVHGYFANREFTKRIGWDTHPSVNMVLGQLKFCCDSVANRQPPEELKTVCDEIYKHMSKNIFEAKNNAEFNNMKRYLENKSWILCGNKFYSADKVVFRLFGEFKDKDSLIVELPIEYTSNYKTFFKDMGVRDEIGVKDLILIIKSTVEGNKDRVLLIDEIKRVIQILEQISRKQRDNKRDRNDPENADDAKAKRFSVIVDERNTHTSKNSLLSQEMVDLQGPALWIYNDVEFTDRDFRSLIKLGKGSKSNEEETIGRFGTGFNCAFHITDLPSIVSGKYIAFLDPNAKFLPAQGYPPRRRRGTRINFIEKEFKKCFSDQCYPYEAIEGCDLSKEFKGTLFRLPLRTINSARKSEISNKPVDIRKILQVFSEVRGNKEMLFLRNIESCSLFHMKNQSINKIWEANIDISDLDRKIRKSVIDKMQTYQLTIELDVNNRKALNTSEEWLLCTGGHEDIKLKQEIKQISKEIGLKVNIKNRTVIPNKSLNDFVRADELYDRNEPLFHKIFANEDKFLPLELQNRVCLEALGRIGLKRLVNQQTFIECAVEIKSQIESGEFPPGVVKDRANYL
ncbi:9091_t:CDS:2, partial [Funneliformis geosporum]